jgi:protein Tex
MRRNRRYVRAFRLCLSGHTNATDRVGTLQARDRIARMPRSIRIFLAELEKPGRDPRPAFKTASFREGVEKLEDLHPGMVLEDVVTNVATFGP